MERVGVAIWTMVLRIIRVMDSRFVGGERGLGLLLPFSRVVRLEVTNYMQSAVAVAIW